MGLNPTAQNALANFINQIVDAAANGGEKAVETLLIAQFPWMSNPIIHEILDDVVQDIGNKEATTIKIFLDFMVIDYQTNGEKSQIYQATQNMYVSLQGGNQNDISTAVQNAKGAWASVIHFDGSANPNN